MPIDSSAEAASTNLVSAFGTLDLQMRYGREQTRVGSRNALRGREEQIALQVRSPFGQIFALPIQLDSQIEGYGLLDTLGAGTPVAAQGRLEWSQRTDARYAVAAGEAGRQANELIVHASVIREAAPGDEPGCDVWVSGTVASSPKIYRHPHKPSLLLAQTALQVSVERRRRGSRAVLVEIQRVPLVVPVDHPGAPALLRPGNHVAVDGMLERITVPQRGPDVDRAVAAAEADWQARRPALLHQPEALRAAERQHVRRVRGLTEAQRSRVVAGYVNLCSGSPATLREAKEIREAALRRSRQGRDMADQG